VRDRLILALPVLVLFGCATRLDPSVLRPDVMAALAMSASFDGRPEPAGRRRGHLAGGGPATTRR